MSKQSRENNASSYICHVRPGKRNDIVEMLPDFETKKKAKKESLLRQKVLSGSKNTEEQQLGTKLSECGKTPCLSPACFVCARQHRRWFFGEANHLSEQYPNVKMMTVINYDSMIPDKKLEQFNPLVHMDRLRKQLERCGITCPIVGSVEIDYHTESKMWLPHFHLMMTGNESNALKKLKKMFKRKTVKVKGRSLKSIRPIRVDKLKDRPKQISYLYKSIWWRVEAYISLDGKRRTYKCRLDNKKLRRSLCIQDKFKFSDFLFLYKVRRYGSKLRVTSVREN